MYVYVYVYVYVYLYILQAVILFGSVSKMVNIQKYTNRAFSYYMDVCEHELLYTIQFMACFYGWWIEWQPANDPVTLS